MKFKVKRISARVYNKENGYSPEFDHFAIVVEIGGSEFLVDVGFGEFIFEPLKLEIGTIQNDPTGYYIIDKFDVQTIFGVREETLQVYEQGIWVEKGRGILGPVCGLSFLPVRHQCFPGQQNRTGYSD